MQEESLLACLPSGVRTAGSICSPETAFGVKTPITVTDHRPPVAGHWSLPLSRSFNHTPDNVMSSRPEQAGASAALACGVEACPPRRGPWRVSRLCKLIVTTVT